jgi:hypothetical protein
MLEEISDERTVRRGIHGRYRWISIAGDVYMGTLLRLCPEAVLHRYIAVTSYDSGIRRLSEEDVSAGWQLRGDIAYSPLVSSVESLAYQMTDRIFLATMNGTWLRPRRAILVGCFMATTLNFTRRL